MVIPRHGSWLCIGPGLRASTCRNYLEDAIVRVKKLKSYRKDYLTKFAADADIRRLTYEKDFMEYVKAIRWLLEDP